MSKRIKSFAIAALLTIVSGSSAFALPGAAFRPNFFRDVPSTSMQMRDGQLKLAPMPFVVFCMQYPGECNASSSPSNVELTPEKFAELKAVNDRVNGAIRPQEDTTVARFWKLDVSVGDCNEFAVQKRHELIKAGWPAAALSLTVAKTTWGEGHLLVTVRTDHGDLVLDSLRSDIVSWDQAHYHWIMRQSASDLTNWVSIEGSAPARQHHYHYARVRHEQVKPTEASNHQEMRAPEPATGRLFRA